jgi:hypothetical protein
MTILVLGKESAVCEAVRTSATVYLELAALEGLGSGHHQDDQNSGLQALTVQDDRLQVHASIFSRSRTRKIHVHI